MPTGLMPTGLMPTGLMPTGLMPTGLMPTLPIREGAGTYRVPTLLPSTPREGFYRERS